MKKTKEKGTKQQAIDHYKKMIKFVKKLPKEDYPDIGILSHELGETWEGIYCPYCKSYSNCIDCPLNIICGTEGTSKEYDISYIDCWYKMDMSSTWEEWLYYANLILKFIKLYG